MTVFSIRAGRLGGFHRAALPAKESFERDFNIPSVATISVGVRATKETSSSGLSRAPACSPLAYDRGRYILEDCFLSSGSHICHAKSPEEA